MFIAVALGVIIGGLVFYQQASTAAMTRNTIQQLTAYGSEIRALCERPVPTIVWLSASFSGDCVW
ncbi:MAG: hypothetical protein JKP98_19585 [Rhodobacteraceae bacterium]|nr:hypothetical protein [Paracoccaceae bacterium]